MAKSLVDCCARLQTLAAATFPGMNAPQYPKDGMVKMPFAVTYPGVGDIDSETVPGTRGIHKIYTEIHYGQIELALSMEKSMPAIEAFAAEVLRDPTLAGTCDTVVGEVHYDFGWLTWGGKQESHIGVRFAVTVKIRQVNDLPN